MYVDANYGASNSKPPVLCRVQFTILPQMYKTSPSAASDSAQGISGIYYRQLVPVIVTAQMLDSNDKALDETLAFMVMVPDRQQVSALEIPRNLFADNTTTITLNQGQPTNYSPQVNSEVLGLFKIPADVIGAYFGAFGKLFTSFGTAKAAETTGASSAAALKAEQYKIQLCLKALTAKVPSDISTYCPTP